MPKLISQKFHAYIDYPVALGLMIMPFLLGLSGLASDLSIATGIAALILTAMTKHETGLFPVFPYKFHLAVDGLVGVAFVVTPFLLSFEGLTMAYYLIIGITVLLVVGTHKPDTQTMTPAE